MSGQWTCQVCTFANDDADLLCQVCGSPEGATTASFAPAPAAAAPAASDLPTACHICGESWTDVATEAYSPGCRHYFCVQCYAEYIDNAFESPTVNPSKVACMSRSCNGRYILFPDLLRLAGPASKPVLEDLLTTVPKTRTPKTLDDFGLEFNSKGVLSLKSSGRPFKPVSERLFYILAPVVMTEIQRLLTLPPYGLHNLWLAEPTANAAAAAPAATAADAAAAGSSAGDVAASGSAAAPTHDSEAKAELPPRLLPSLLSDKLWMQLAPPADPVRAPRCNVLASEDLWTNTRGLLLLMPGSGGVRAGIWGRTLCLLDSLRMGAMLECVAEGRRRGLSVLILNPNLNEAEGPVDDPDAEAKAAPAASDTDAGAAAGAAAGADMLAYYTRPPLTYDQRELLLRKHPPARIPGHASPRQHLASVRARLLPRVPAQDVFIVAHSAGGAQCVELLVGDPSLRARTRFVAFTDSIHSCMESEVDVIGETLLLDAANFVTSSRPLEAVERAKGFVEARRRLAEAAGTRPVQAPAPEHYALPASERAAMLALVAEETAAAAKAKASSKSKGAAGRGGLTLLERGCVCVSAGTLDHASTNACAMEVIFRYFDARRTAPAAQSAAQSAAGMQAASAAP